MTETKEEIAIFLNLAYFIYDISYMIGIFSCIHFSASDEILFLLWLSKTTL